MAAIKISDLSIGDWVNQKMNDGAYQVQWIEREIVGLIKHTGTEEDGSIRLTAVPLSFIEPIPITPEILEKNGFRKNGEYNEWNIGTWQTPYLLGVSLERPAIAIKWNGSSIFIDQAKYVHQLQQAMRLAGVEKKIEL